MGKLRPGQQVSGAGILRSCAPPEGLARKHCPSPKGAYGRCRVPTDGLIQLGRQYKGAGYPTRCHNAFCHRHHPTRRPFLVAQSSVRPPLLCDCGSALNLFVPPVHLSPSTPVPVTPTMQVWARLTLGMWRPWQSDPTGNLPVFFSSPCTVAREPLKTCLGSHKQIPP